MTVVFVDGSAYDYKEVPPQIFEGLIQAPSAGSYLHRQVKDKYNFKKVL